MPRPFSTDLRTRAVGGLVACTSVEAATGREVFLAFVERVLAPALAPGQIVVLGNVSA